MNPLRKIKRLLDKILGDKSDKLFWQFRHFLDRDWADSYISDGAINHPHRKLLVEKISKYYPFKNVLEIGAASGPNLYLLAKKFPEVNFVGVDVSARAIEAGRSFFATHNINNVIFSKTEALRLEGFRDKSMDIVFSDATLIYVGSDKISSAIKDMVRIAKKSIILCEQHTNGESFYDDKWVHNYKTIIEEYVPNAKIYFTKISDQVWQGDWGKYGNIIEITL